MLGQHGKHTVPEWSFVLLALAVILAVALFYVQMTDVALPTRRSSMPADTNAGLTTAQLPSVSVLRAAWSGGTGAHVPESTMGGAEARATSTEVRVSVATLRTVKPDFAGAAVPDVARAERLPSVELLRTVKPDFAGAAVPESTFVGD